MIEARQLSRSFRTFARRPGVLGAVRDLFRLGGEERLAVDGVDLHVAAGEVVGFIGPNGAGKSTTIKMMTGVLRPTGGSLRVNGLEPFRDRRRHVRNIGVVYGQRTQLWWDLAVVEAFDLLAAIFQVDRDTYRRRLERFDSVLGIRPLLHQPVRELSLGQRMRCDIAAALIHGPPLLFLDEPTIGLDVAVKRRIRDFIGLVNEEEGTTVLLTTHDLSDVEAACERVVLIDHGRVLFDGPTPALKDSLGGRRRMVVDLAREEDATPALVEGLPVVWEIDGARLTLRFRRDEVTAGTLIGVLTARAEVADLSVEEPDIEDVVARFYEDADARRLAAMEAR
ncbi:MAG: ATP-binding cassette domain-containing protein [Deltaproteobacteria bacterium]|nr:MAG: ATP-binding cassette domain-containing protein [Deltaproteobacteria bacterium]